MTDIIIIGCRDMPIAMPTAMQYLSQECTRLKAEKAELLEALKLVVMIAFRDTPEFDKAVKAIAKAEGNT